jgi:Glycosyl transferase family 2
VTIARVALDRLRAGLRPLRRQTIVGPLLDAVALRAVLTRIADPERRARVLGPQEFAPYIRELTTLTPHSLPPMDLRFDAVVVRQDHLNGLPAPLLAALHAGYACAYANRTFLLFEPAASPATAASTVAAAVQTRLAALTGGPPRMVGRLVRPDVERAIVVTTFDRPAALERSLPQVAALGPAVLVVDDGSSTPAAERNRCLADALNVRYLRLPDNRGLAGALNVGLAYWLADTRVRWVSYVQDDVDVDPRLLEVLRIVEDPDERPLLTGYDADEHPAERVEIVHGTSVAWKRSTPAVHLHGHVDYWRGVLPIPTEYLGAPRRRWEASLEDYWIVNHAPHSLGARGRLVPCVPGLVRTFLWHAADSTWGNPNLPDPPLGRSDPGGGP